MDRARAKELLPIIEAFANGEEIQFKHSLQWLKNDPSVERGWQPCNEILPCFNEADYRIKPKPREFWIQVELTDSDRDGIVSAWDRRPMNTKGELIKVREVIE